MIKYVMTATALKMFSTSSQTKRVYRMLGNTLGQRKRIRQGLSKEYVQRAKEILELCEKYHVIQKGDKLLEIGTGWVHWEATIIRLFYDVEITLFDIWDNRHFAAYKHYCRQFDEIIDKELPVSTQQREHAHQLIQGILKASSFEEIYTLLDFRYVINPKGTFEPFQDGSFALLFSSNVLEHIDNRILFEFTQDFRRLLKPGGYSIHQIDLGDHLAYYDRSVPLKNYLKYSDKVWKRYFENDLQYINLVQRPEWLELFQKAGLETVVEESIPIEIGNIKLDKRYADLGEQDLQCRTLRVVHRKSS